MCRRIFILISLCFSFFHAFTQENYRISFEFDNYNNDTLLLAYFYADRQLVKDTILADSEGSFVYSGSDTLQSGVYILMFFPGKEYIQFIVNEEEPFFRIKGDFKDLDNPSFEGSTDNELFYGYLAYIRDMRARADEINAQRDLAAGSGTDTTIFDQQLILLDEEVRAYQDSLLSRYPASMTTLLIKGNQDVDFPDFGLEGEELQKMRFYYYRNHFFDHIDLGDPRTLRTPFLHNKLERYLDKLTVQTPDSAIVAVDYLLSQMEPAMDTWKFYVAHFLNKYGRMQIIGMDAVYVHMVDTYYATGRTPWADEETLAKILDEADKLRPVLLGKLAPDVTLFTQEGEPVRIHDIESPYTVLIFWAPDCGHCKNSMPKVVEFNEKFKDKGVAIVAICTKHTDKLPDCWDFIKEKNMEGLLYNLADEYHRSRFQLKYNVRTTPQVFILDKDKKILLKKIAPEKLEEVMLDVFRVDGYNVN